MSLNETAPTTGQVPLPDDGGVVVVVVDEVVVVVEDSSPSDVVAVESPAVVEVVCGDVVDVA